MGTWQRVERGDKFEYPSLVRMVEAMGWAADAADVLLDGRDPDNPEPQELFPTYYAEQEEAERDRALERMESWPRHLVRALGHHGRYLTDVEKEDVVASVAAIANPRAFEDRERKRAAKAPQPTQNPAEQLQNAAAAEKAKKSPRKPRGAASRAAG